MQQIICSTSSITWNYYVENKTKHQTVVSPLLDAFSLFSLFFTLYNCWTTTTNEYLRVILSWIFLNFFNFFRLLILLLLLLSGRSLNHDNTKPMKSTWSATHHTYHNTSQDVNPLALVY